MEERASSSSGPALYHTTSRVSFAVEDDSCTVQDFGGPGHGDHRLVPDSVLLPGASPAQNPRFIALPSSSAERVQHLDLLASTCPVGGPGAAAAARLFVGASGSSSSSANLPQERSNELAQPRRASYAGGEQQNQKHMSLTLGAMGSAGQQCYQPIEDEQGENLLLDCAKLDDVARSLHTAIGDVNKAARQSKTVEKNLRRENAQLKIQLDAANLRIVKLERQLEAERKSKTVELGQLEAMYNLLVEEMEQKATAAKAADEETAAGSPLGSEAPKSDYKTPAKVEKCGAASNHSGSTTPQPQEEP
mmetsp:Transcript_27199/g.68613  ORF Transcript_27199/g.68613 Transcript_27199/m.68613 type:complete len:305 (-) Transcript_27199:405-1319(-)|eukprot:CAMPEP_0179006030 /NCGR_PEP_ID=MMETSP0795-20121207/14306_1 /TAXON_ID=88552 /ORGANISM="Amoebophrya sp., Strain Ameob2" /LENGTH=304 /DNA_ID=CAMNT_0020700703 /DNA_START=58 /DNA_END=972 /DNA_ORIENTATION=+